MPLRTSSAGAMSVGSLRPSTAPVESSSGRTFLFLVKFVCFFLEQL